MAVELKDMGGTNGSPISTAESVRPSGVGDVDCGKPEQPLLKSESYAVESPAAEELASCPADNLDELGKNYAAFVRKDVYGIMGRGELPTLEKVMLGIAVVTLVPIRVAMGIFLLVLHALFYSESGGRAGRLRSHDWVEEGGRGAVWEVLSRVMLFNFGFYWIRETHLSEDEHREISDESKRPGVIVSNHVSYLDILYHMSSSFPSFVAKRSVAKLPLVGIISKCLGCVYVQRESKSSDFKGVSGIVTERIVEAHQDKNAPMMLLFPEGTTTNGDYLLPFKTGAFLANVPVLPVILRYPYQRFSPAWDSISGVRHIVLLLCQFINHIEVIHLPVYYPSEQEKKDHKLYANNVRKLMACEGNLTLSDMGLAEKRVYHAALNGLFIQR
ncbi:hypothetical protein HPP92_000124 [Vanilla planifolia]|uniref:Phospholipid/glycerol acyltransferase domain-containing protein n=1 Tax=Vanilla planifolia TaxID=51239 RepID=A0A835S9L2_VANPL|nr:hypothetical protein HPP92_000124 [Vanilla planifolia]